MTRIKVVDAGYTIKVRSWENDGDYTQEHSMIVKTPKVAEAIYNLCKTVFVNSCNDEGGIGNTFYEDRPRVKEIVVDYMKEHPELYPDKEDLHDSELFDIAMDYNRKLLGRSETYYSRVFESCTVTYSSEDIYVTEVKF